MPTKRELRELDDTQNLNLKEIQNDNDALDIPDFHPDGERSPLIKKVLNEEGESAELETDKKPMIIGIIVLVVFVIIICLITMFKSCSSVKQGDSESAVTATPTAETEEAKDTLDFYYMQAANTAIVTRLNEDYGTDYTKPSTDQYEISGSQDSPVINFNLTVGDAYKKNYIMPAEFHLNWNSSESQYEITSYTIDETEAKESGWKSNSSKKEAKQQAKEVSSEDSKMVSSFDVTVRNSVTVTISSNGNGKVTAYAISKDGTKTEIASTSSGEVTKTVKLEAGDYTLALYSEDGAVYSWNYSLG